VLWSRSYDPTFEALSQSSRSPINTLVRDVMIENKANPDEGFEKDGLKIRWTVENGLGLVFVVS
jgi:signal recognition particle receptor subunit alpha